MSEQPSLTAFTDVDADGGGRAFVSYLDAVNDSDVARAYKQLTYAMLEPTPTQTLLDIGCGTGDDVIALAALVGPNGEVVGIDSSHTMIEEARRRTATTTASVRFAKANAYELPFVSATFDGCRADRVFHHLDQPQAALTEIARICRPGARLVISDPDWQTLVVDHEDDETTRTITRFFSDEYQNGGIAHAVPRLCRKSGFSDVKVTPIPVILNSLAAAEQMLELTSAAERAATGGAITHTSCRRWLADLAAADGEGSFFAAFLGLIVRSSRSGRPRTRVM
jgi:ubiquinone/menaquinone biosynthesis C-methylase UbiE